MTSSFSGRLLATSDLHVSHRINRAALAGVGRYPDDWLIVAGDVGEKPEHLVLVLDTLLPRFAKVIWTPGNHDLWSGPTGTTGTRGQARYDELVSVCRARGVTTPEDPYLEWPGMPGTFIVPMFLLFDYSFRPAHVAAERAIDWAREHGVVSGDELMLDPTPWPSRAKDTPWNYSRHY